MKVQQLQTWLVAMTLSGSVGIASCALDAGGDDGSRDVRLQEQGLYGHLCSDCTYWNGNLQGSTQPAAAVVPVCWSLTATQNKGDPQGLSVDASGNYVPDAYRNKTLPSTSPGFATIKKWVRQGVENSWARVANVKFTGWDTTCVSNGTADDRPLNPGKLILTLDSGFDITDFLGKSSSMANKTYINATKSGQGSYEAYIIHEVGHALGFDHEAERPDNYSNNGNIPSTCLLPNQKSPGGEYLNVQPGGPTWVDVNSIMCYDNRPNKLSAGDIMGVQRLYGIHPAGRAARAVAAVATAVGSSCRTGACREAAFGLLHERAPVHAQRPMQQRVLGRRCAPCLRGLGLPVDGEPAMLSGGRLSASAVQRSAEREARRR